MSYTSDLAQLHKKMFELLKLEHSIEKQRNSLPLWAFSRKRDIDIKLKTVQRGLIEIAEKQRQLIFCIKVG